MGFFDWLKKPQHVELAAAQPDVVPDLGAFQRAQFGALTAPQVVSLIQTVQGDIGPFTRPEEIPLATLDVMGWDGTIYLGEQTATAPIKDPELYYVRHKDPGVVAETEEWLWPLLPDLLPILCRSLAYGAIPYVFDWHVEDLQTTVNGRGKKFPGHVHYSKVHEIFPGDVEIVVDNGNQLIAVRHGGKDYGADRAYVSIHGAQFGRWLGQGSRRRAYKAWYAAELVELWHNRWLERSVDPPRIGFAPAGVIKIDGVEYQATDLLRTALMALKNGGATVLPSTMDPETRQKLWGIDIMQLPDRSDVWEKAFNRYDVRKLTASLVPASTVGMEDATFASARVPATVFVDFVQSNAQYIAAQISRIVAAVHAVNRPSNIPAPEVLAYELPQAKRKLLLEVFRTVASVERQVGEGKSVTLAEMVDDDLITQLGLTKRPVEEAAREKQSPPPMGPLPGRPKDATGEREERRDSAREPEGEDATGDSREGVE